MGKIILVELMIFSFLVFILFYSMIRGNNRLRNVLKDQYKEKK